MAFTNPLKSQTLLTILTLLTLLTPVTPTPTDFSPLINLSTWDQATWSLTTNTFIPGQYQARVSLANGYIGASLAAAGPFFERDVNQTDPEGGVQPTNGWPLFDERIAFSTVSGFWDVQPNGTGTNYPWLNQYGWESFISGIPHSTAIIFTFGDHYLDATVENTTISNFSQKLSFKTGIGEWSYTWSPTNSTSFNISYATFFSRERPNVVAVSASITPSDDINGTVTDLLDGRSALRTEPACRGMDDSTIYSAVHPSGLPNVTAWVVSGVDFCNEYTDLSSRMAASGPYISTDNSTIGQTYKLSLKKGQVASFYKYVGTASTDKYPDAESQARNAQTLAQKDGWDALNNEHVAAWAEILTESSIDNFTDPITGQLPSDPNIQALQIASVANTFYLLSNLQPEGSGLNDNSIAVGGLASDSYAGLIFWDADYWMAPGLNLAFPSWSKQISNFRVKQHPQALANAAFNGYPEGSALYSWTAGRYGNCTGTGPCVDYEYHLNYDIAFNLLQQYNITHNATWFQNGPRQVIESAADMTGNLLQFNETTGTYWLHNCTDPDEYANNVDNGAFTIASARELLVEANALRLAQGLPVNETWVDQIAKINFPRAASNITLEYQTMNDSVAVKQADVVLLTYPLDYSQNYTAADKLLDLDYYANKQSPSGPAMTYSIFAISASTLSPSGCSAYTYTLNGILPYLRAPWYQFSEQAVDSIALNGGQNPAFPFLTGHGGANQVVPFGFLGIRTDGEVLALDPSLPPQIKWVRVRRFYFAGATLEAVMNSTHTNITRLPTPASSGLQDAYVNTLMPFTVGSASTASGTSAMHHISINQTLTLPNRLYGQIPTTPNNLLQCLPATSPDPYIPGQFPLAAIDGATATRWQPDSNTSASLVVDMSSTNPARVASLFFDWGARPPRSARVILSNHTSTTTLTQAYVETCIQIPGITPSLPYNATSEAGEEVVPVKGNTTTVILGEGEQVWSGRRATLVVEGCWEEDGMGATVGEFVLVGG